MPAEYAHHYSLLVYALHILLGFSRSPHDLNIANDLLLYVYQHMPELYGDTLCLINVHNLIHLVPLVKQWGPLWVYSCFGFKSMNGHLTTQHPKVSSDGVVFLGKRKRGPLYSSQYRVLIEYIGHHHVANVFETAEQIRKGHDMFITAQSRMTVPNAAVFVEAVTSNLQYIP